MIERSLMTPDELKSIPKGNFVIMKTGVHPVKTKLHLFLDWGIRFTKPYVIEEKANRKVVYADKRTLEENIINSQTDYLIEDDEGVDIFNIPNGVGTLHTPMTEATDNAMRKSTTLKT